MEEQLILFETAKLAREKGFTEFSTHLYFVQSGEEGKPCMSTNINPKYPEPLHNDWYSAPTQSLLQKWLREVHLKYVQPTVGFHGRGFRVGKIPTGFVHPDGIERIISYHNTPRKKYNTYEEALEAGLLYALTMINI